MRKQEMTVLSDNFIRSYQSQKPDFGYNGLGMAAFLRTYSRLKEDGSNERWYEVVERVVNGSYRILQSHIMKYKLPWDPGFASEQAQIMYDRIFTMKFLPPGRGLWAMGTAITDERKLFASLNNCSFTSTKDLKKDVAKPFRFMMDMSMLGAGVGFDTEGAGTVVVNGFTGGTIEFVIPDSREGWVDSLDLLIKNLISGGPRPVFNYSEIRPKGSPIKVFGGVATGFECLQILHTQVTETLSALVGNLITETAIVDVMNQIGVCVVSGNVRRTAEIALSHKTTDEFLDLKNHDLHPERDAWAWASNNSRCATIGMDYSDIGKRILYNGEPGLLWLENARAYGRMCDPMENKDSRALGANPCMEQTLEDKEMCNLVEMFLNRHDSVEDLLVTSKYAYLYAKIVTLGMTHWPETNRIMIRNRRIGSSLSGIAQYLARHGVGTFVDTMKRVYGETQRLDNKYSEWLGIPRSIKTTSIKPSGTISLLTGATPGVHFPISEYYIRTMRAPYGHPLVAEMERRGYPVEPSAIDANTAVISFPIKLDDGIKTEQTVTMWEQLELAALVQHWYADNQVSVTIKFDPDKEGHDISRALEYYQYRLKGVSFLSKKIDYYPQMPYQPTTKEVYEDMMSKITILDEEIDMHTDAEKSYGCDGDSCELPQKVV